MTEYGLEQVWIPEDQDLPEEEYKKLGKNNIFMSPDFKRDFEGPWNRENALILI